MEINNKFIIFIPYCNLYHDYIIECLESVENQNYNNFKVIIINDGGDKNINLNNFVKNKDIYTIVNKPINEGPASSKYEFIKYIRNNINRFNLNDIAIIIDGDDTVSPDLLEIVNNKYNSTKCWCTFGECEGKYCDISTKLVSYTNWENIRNENWCVNHPRTFKLFLLMDFKEHDFKYNNNFMLKCTDRPLVYDTFEMCSNNKIEYIIDTLYFYRNHSKNSIKTVSEVLKNNILKHIISKPKKEKITEDIHIVKYFKTIDTELVLFIKSIYEMNILNVHFHILISEKSELPELKNLEQKKKIKISTMFCNESINNKYTYIRDILFKKYIIDYVIITDEKKINDIDIRLLWENRKPKSYINYHISNLNIDTNITWDNFVKLMNKKPIENTYNYIVDINIFNPESIFFDKIPLSSVNESLISIEYLWLLFIMNKYNYKLETLIQSEELLI